MRTLIITIASLMFSITASAREYGSVSNPYEFRPYVAIMGGQGKLGLTQRYLVREENEDGEMVDGEYLKLKNSGRETWSNFSLGADFVNYPVELVLSYGNIGAGQSDAADFVEDDLVTGEETVVERYEVSQDYDLNAWSLSAKLDLSWNCRAACAYLLAGYSYGDLDWKLAINEVIDNQFNYSESKTLSKGFPHVGAGFRYAFSDHLRANAEYVFYNVGVMGDIQVADGERVEFDVGKLPVLQAGVAYTF